MTEKFTDFRSQGQVYREVKAVGIQVGEDGKTAVAYGIDSTGVVSTLRQEGTVGELPGVKNAARRIARSFEATFIPPDRKPLNAS